MLIFRWNNHVTSARSQLFNLNAEATIRNRETLTGLRTMVAERLFIDDLLHQQTTLEMK